MSISVVIPAWNESACIRATVENLRELGAGEIIVVDGGSTDATITEASHADRVISAPAGRASQMNLGARVATGDILLFLHADCTLEPGALEAIAPCLARRQVVAGCFSMRIAGQGLGFRCIDAAATLRVRLTGVAYGDQGLFLRTETFHRLGGFPPLRFMEDVFFSRRLCREGRVTVLPNNIHVSARRWRKHGLVGQSLRNWTLTALALAGVSPDRLAEYYPHAR